jgi:hypothetical protein
MPAAASDVQCSARAGAGAFLDRAQLTLMAAGTTTYSGLTDLDHPEGPHRRVARH